MSHEHIELPEEVVRDAVENHHDPRAIHRLGIAAAREGNNVENTGIVSRFFRNQWTKGALALGAGAALAGGATYAAMGGQMPDISGTAGDAFSSIGNGLGQVPEAWNAITSDGYKAAAVLGVGALGVGALWSGGRQLLEGGQETRNKYRAAQDSLTRQERMLEGGSGVMLNHAGAA